MISFLSPVKKTLPVEEVLGFRLFSSWAAADPSLSLLGSQEVFSPFPTKALMVGHLLSPRRPQSNSLSVPSPCINKPFSPIFWALIFLEEPNFPPWGPVWSQNKAKRQLSSFCFASAVYKRVTSDAQQAASRCVTQTPSIMLGDKVTLNSASPVHLGRLR